MYINDPLANENLVDDSGSTNFEIDDIVDIDNIGVSHGSSATTYLSLKSKNVHPMSSICGDRLKRLIYRKLDVLCTIHVFT